MKFEDFLVAPSEEHKRLQLEEEVMKLQTELEAEQALNRVLQSALTGPKPVLSYPCLSSLLPSQVQVLLAEVAMVEEEIVWLERKAEELKLSLYKEKKVTKDWQLQQQTRMRRVNRLLREPGSQSLLNDGRQRSRSQNYDESRRDTMLRDRRSSFSIKSNIHSVYSTRSNESYENSRRHTGTSRRQCYIDKESGIEGPNELSEELLKCLIGIYLGLHQESLDKEESAIVPKLALSCITPKGFIAKTSNFKGLTFLSNDNASNLNPYGTLPDLESIVREVGPYKNFIQITRRTLDTSRFSECLPEFEKLRLLMNKLCYVDLTYLNNKQKLAFWINVCNACIMNAFIEHGLPSTHEKLLALMNKAAVNVGGIVLNALAIEHFILRHPCDAKHGPVDQKEMLLRHAYGLGYPEPNVTFALCRGSWSSPALRIYTPDEVVNELGRAKVEYLEASVGVTSKRKIVVPKLLQWHMHDFADEMESLLEWIYSQLPRSTLLKSLIMECLNGEPKSPATKMVEIQPYESEFRYLIPM